jgi:RNA polymerase sigma-70 factor (ECF subfamily)
MKLYSKEELLQLNKLKKGNEKAFEYFFNKYYDSILGFCIQFIYNKPEAKGITQEAFINLWSSRQQIEKINGIESFLYTYAKSKCLNVIRDNKVKERYKSKTLNKKERALDYDILKSMNFDSLALTELEELITKSIDDLPEKSKVVFYKKRYENKKNKEIAQDLNVTVKTVEAYMTTALKILRLKLTEYLPLIFVSILIS